MGWSPPGRRGVMLSAALFALVLAIPSAGAVEPRLHAVLATPSVPTPGPAGTLIAPAFVPDGQVRTLGPMAPSFPIEVAVTLARSDPAGLASEINLEHTPGSSEYRHYLTPAQVADRFGPSLGSYSHAAAYFRSQGLRVSESPDRTVLLVSGASSTLGHAFGTSFEIYQDGPRQFYSHPNPARLPSGLPWAGAIGLGNASPIHPYAHILGPKLAGPQPSAAPCSSSSWVTPCIAQSVYNLSGILGGGVNGSGYRIGVVDTYDGSEPQTALKSDFTTFTGQYSLPYGNVSFVYPVPTSKNLNSTTTGWGIEEALDLQWARAMAPGAAIDMTMAPDASTGLYASVDWLVAHHSVDVISMSWGEPDVGKYNSYQTACSFACNASSDGSYTILSPVLQAAAAEGISVFAASGDCGAAGGTSRVSTGYPASDLYVTGVGATNLAVSSSNSWVSETGWSGNTSGSSSPGCQNQGGSGGGFSPFPRPSWQSGPGVPTTPALRGEPDVSILGGAPGALIVVGGQTYPEGGTSLSSPMWAGLAAVADQRAGMALGFLNPSLYAIARGPSGTKAFHDILQGWNGFNATPGWDPVTGLGSPNASVLVPLLTGLAVGASTIRVNLTASPRYAPAPATVTLRASATGGTGRYAFYDLDFGDGNSSIAFAGTASHTYRADGVYSARAVAYDSSSNASWSIPVAVVIGGGGMLNVTLNASSVRPGVGASVLFRVAVTGGTAPYTYHYAFGDGTYLDPSNRSPAAHTFGAKGAYCATVIVGDNSSPPEGGSASPVAIAVGGASLPTCPSSTKIVAALSLSTTSADLPGDLQFRTTASGGIGPYTVHYSSDDPYVGACQCGIFSTPGTHTVAATVADSFDGLGNTSTTVAIYPALAGRFSANPEAGPVPLTVRFSVSLSGGHLANPNSTFWQFGDGFNATGAAPSHTYLNPGWYVATGLVADASGGRASAAFLVDAYAPGPPPAAIVAAKVAPALETPSGSVVNVSANVTGSGGPYLIRWDLGENGSAFGPTAQQSYGYLACRAQGTCPLALILEVEDHSGSWKNLSILLSNPSRGNASALVLTDSVGTLRGPTPFHFLGSASAVGMPGPRIGWTFGDGATSNSSQGTHTYLSPGNYTVVETATDGLGDRLVRSHALVVIGPQRYPPNVTGGPNSSSGVVPFSLDFSVLASGGAGGPYSYSWTYGDGASGTGPVVTHAYWTPGHLVANLTAADRLGDTTTVSFPIRSYNVTRVAFDLYEPSGAVRVGGSFLLQVDVFPDCGPDSVAGCSARIVPLGIAVLPPGSAPPAAFASGLRVAVGATGWANVTLSVPNSAGSYEVYVWARGGGFVGSAVVPVTVLGGATGTSSIALEVSLGISAAVALGAAIWLLGRRRPVRPPPGAEGPIP